VAGQPGGERHGSGRFDGEAELLPQPVAGGHDLGLAHQYRPDAVSGEQGERLSADAGRAQRRGRDRVHLRVDGLPGRERRVQAVAVLRFDGGGEPATRRERDPRGEPTTADGDRDGVDLRRVPHDLGPDRALARDHGRVVVGLEIPRAGRVRRLARRCRRLGIGVAGADQPRTGGFDPPCLVFRHLRRHVDGRGQAEELGGGGHTDAVVAARSRDDLVRTLTGEQRVECPAQFERAGPLKMFELEHQRPAVDLGTQQRGVPEIRANAAFRGGDVRAQGGCHGPTVPVVGSTGFS